MPRVGKPEFRKASKTWFITWSQCDVSKEAILELIKSKGTLVDYVVAQEDHKEADDQGCVGKHIHAAFKYNRKVNVTSARAFDIQGHHPYIELGAIRSYADTRNYCMKDGDYLTNSTLAPFDHFNGHNYLKRLADYEAQRTYLEKQKAKEPVWPIILPDGKTEWAPVLKKRGLWIVGPSSANKTRWFRNLFDNNNWIYFEGNDQPYPFENYNKEQVLLFDDRDPTLEQVKQCINIHGRWTSCGKTRFKQYYWKYHESTFYCVMIVLSNHVPVFSNEDTFTTRFDLIHTE